MSTHLNLSVMLSISWLYLAAITLNWGMVYSYLTALLNNFNNGYFYAELIT